MTILEQIKAKYPNVEGIDDARNIAEAMACVSGTGGRGAGAIADHILEGESEPVMCTITLENGLETFGVGEIVAEQGTEVELPTVPLNPGSITFIGWSVNPDAREYTVNNPYTVSHDVTLYQYVIGNNTYSAYLDLNIPPYTGEGFNVLVDDGCISGDEVALPEEPWADPTNWPNAVIPDTLHFKGVNYNADDTTVLRENVIVGNGNIQFYMIWTENPVYKVILTYWNGWEETYMLEEGETLELPTSETPGFEGWVTTLDDSTTMVSSPYTPQANITLYEYPTYIPPEDEEDTNGD